jgi:hypothetical protein
VSPNGISPVLLIILRHAKSVVDAGKDRQEPCDDGHDFIRPNGLDIVGVASCERVCFECISNEIPGSDYPYRLREAFWKCL